MKRIKLLLILCVFFSLGMSIQAADWLDTSDLTNGVVHVTYKKNTTKRVKVMIEKDKEKYTYDVMKRDGVETFPLQLGNGTYKITLLENTTAKKYRIIDSETVKLNLTEPNNVYLNSIQNIDWNKNSSAIQNANKLTEKKNSNPEKVQVLYSDIVFNYRYDYNKLAQLPTMYLPIIDETYHVKTGICYDFASLYAAVLRSQGIPCKLVKGYSTNAQGYHAWNEVYDEKSKTWKIIDTTYDLQVITKKPFLNKIKETKEYEKVYEY